MTKSKTMSKLHFGIVAKNNNAFPPFYIYNTAFYLFLKPTCLKKKFNNMIKEGISRLPISVRLEPTPSKVWPKTTVLADLVLHPCPCFVITNQAVFEKSR